MVSIFTSFSGDSRRSTSLPDKFSFAPWCGFCSDFFRQCHSRLSTALYSPQQTSQRLHALRSKFSLILELLPHDFSPPTLLCLWFLHARCYMRFLVSKSLAFSQGSTLLNSAISVQLSFHTSTVGDGPLLQRFSQPPIQSSVQCLDFLEFFHCFFFSFGVIGRFSRPVFLRPSSSQLPALIP
eukprot:Gb_14496 [translate_table: standard]